MSRRTLFSFALGAALVFAPSHFVAQDKTLDQLLEELRVDLSTDSEANRKREADFRAKRNQQRALLNQAVAERKRQEARSERLEAVFQEHERELAQLEEQLAERLGSLGELFGVVRQVAGETRETVDNSMVTAQHPQPTFPRGEADPETGERPQITLLDALAGSRDLPSIDDLEQLWFALQQEITESGKVVRFNAPVTLLDGSREVLPVTRIGVFTAISDGDFLQYADGRLQLIERQPGGRILRAAGNFEGADAGERVTAPLDPSKGTILSLLVQAPSAGETIEQGGGVGYIIILIGLFGVAVSLWRFTVLYRTTKSVNAQTGQSANTNNPLGRVMKVYEDNPAVDVETLELKLDEAILREVPKLEAWLSTIKVFSAIAPLLGLLGTVTGMIETFQMITLFGTGDPKLMAGGISEALVTTMLGLIVAIPLTFLHAVVQSRSKNITEVLEEQSAGMVARRAEA